ncbi:hypothetical protein BDN72DRAFT_902385 [Pluteus cervinus]|uniref:Uncharacterized protein n=1 Tax=Pluteus cervinus TaxID=181527 RepID=A0ACD3AF53_9AGAR|nr:hypothetical protein BDN72DRAFT_902385 [Pluteus cervinus]
MTICRLSFYRAASLIHKPHRRLFTTTQRNDSKPYYITTPIFYPNAVPHIGHLYSLVIADIFARYQRLLNPGTPVQFLAGTDEHGLKIQKAAQLKGIPPLNFCDQLSEQFRNLSTAAHITHDRFMRTTSDTHHRAVEHIWNKLNDRGLIYKGKYSGWYSITDECFYTENQIGPSSQDPNVMVSLETGAQVEWSNEENYMFRLSNFRSPLHSHYSAHRSIFPSQHHTHILDILSEPLEDLSISRPRSRLHWGLQVPNDPSQTVYVWFDALLVYLSGLGYPWHGGGTGEAEGWPVNLQLIGKDILRFHAIYLPAILKALDLPLQERILAHAHWTVEQKKMSKSLGNVADPFEAIDEFGLDVVRYYLARVGGHFKDDVDWSRSQLDKHSKELKSLLGNFLLRIASPKIQARIINQSSAHTSPSSAPLLEAAHQLVDLVEASLERLDLSDALEHITELLRLANKTITDVAPWKPSCPPEDVMACYIASVETLRVAGICLQPFVPDTSKRLLDALAIPASERTWGFARKKYGGHSPRFSAVDAVKLF